LWVCHKSKPLEHLVTIQQAGITEISLFFDYVSFCTATEVFVIRVRCQQKTAAEEGMELREGWIRQNSDREQVLMKLLTQYLPKRKGGSPKKKQQVFASSIWWVSLLLLPLYQGVK
jgi:hypothetical protein